MQNDDQKQNNDANKELKTIEIDEGNQTDQTSAMSGHSLIESPPISTAQSTFGLDVSCSDEDEVSEVDSFILDQDETSVIEPSFLLPESMEGANLQTVTVDAETHARLEALLEAAGIGKLSTADGKALTDPEVLRKLTSSVSCALDEAAQALHRMRAEKQSQLGNIDRSRSLAEACTDGDVPTVRKLLKEGGSVHETTEEGDSLLSLACSAGYYELAQVLLAMKANVEDRGIKGDCTPLMEAASGGFVDIVKLLIVHGADVNAQSSAGNTPLHYAACGGYVDVVQVLIETGANVEQHNENGHTPLMEASSAGHVGVASILLSAGAGINTHSNEFKESALTLACYKGHLDMVKFLLEAGADQEHKTDEMHTALMEASMDGHVEVARLLLDSGAQVNMPADSFESPLTLAACGGHVELANLLIERGANLEEVNDEGYTPLMEAAREGHEEMVALLLAHDGDINAQTEETQETALTLACCGGFIDVADFLISAGADIELGCSTPLMEAAQEGHLELVKYLLKAGAKVQAQTGTGDTALTYACENGHTDVAESLLQHGADLEHESEGGRTPLMKAARAGHLCTVQYLISRGADVNRQTSTNDHTVLSLACAGGHLAVVELLLAQGADPAHKLKDGSTMVIEAAKGGHTQVVKLLLEYPNRMLMNPNPDVPQVTSSESHHVESRVPIHGLGNIVPPSEPDSRPAKPNNLALCDLADSNKRRTGDKDMNIPLKSGEQILQNMQKSLKRTLNATTNCHVIDQGNKTGKASNVLPGTSGEVSPQLSENGGLPDLIPDEAIDLRAGERLEALISNVMAKELINTTSTREEQILRKQQILEELQKVERELQEKAQQQLLITAQHQLEQQQQQQQLQQALQQGVMKSLHKTPQIQAEEQQANNTQLSSSQFGMLTSELQEAQMSNNLDKQGNGPTCEDSSASSPPIRPNICEEGAEPSDGGLVDKQNSQDSSNPAYNNNNSNEGGQSTNGESYSSEPNTETQTQQPLQPPPKPPQLLTQQQQQLEQQLQQRLQQQQPVVNPPFVLNDSQRLSLQNLIMRQQQEAQQLAQETSLPMPQFPQLQLTPHQQDQLFQVLSQQQFPQQQQLSPQQQQQQQQQQQLSPQQQSPQQQQLQPATSAAAPLSSQQLHASLKAFLTHPIGLENPNAQQFLTPQQQQQLLNQQQHARFLQQQMQQIKPPVNQQKQVVRKQQKTVLNIQQVNNAADPVSLESVTPPPSTPLTPNPSPASPQSISPLYAPIDLDAQTESNHDTALTLACAGGHAELVTLLLSKGADIEHRDKKGFTPLILAATAGHVDVVEILLDASNGADIEAQSERTKDTPLSLACSGGRYEVVELLLSRGANKEHRNVSDYTPLSLAASGGYVNIIKLLLSHGAEINSRTGSKLGISPLMLAAMNGHTAAVKMLLDMGSDINAQIETNRNTALTLACFQGRHEVVSLLVDRRANIEHRAKTGLTPLMEAASGGYVEVGRVLLDKGADVNAPPVPSSRDTALTIAADKGHYRFVELLLSRHAAVDVKNKKGNSPLWLACNGGHLDVVQLLVTARADIDSQDNRKVSCLMAAFRKGHVKVVKWMVKAVSQFPSDQELSRYIATITDKELQKKCQQCMEIIVSAKDRQAAEANKAANSLLEELDKERQHEENKKAAAAKKREKKKQKKKEKQVKDNKETSNSKNSSPEPESDNSQPQEEKENEMIDRNAMLYPPTATTTSTLGLTLPTSSEPIYSGMKSKVKSNNKMEKRYSKAETLIVNVDISSKADTDNKTKTEQSEKNNTSTTESKKNKKNRKERMQESKMNAKVSTAISSSVTMATTTITTSSVSSNSKSNKGQSSVTPSSNSKKKKGEVSSSTTAIGDLDDFGNLPSISEKDIEKLRKNVEKTKISNSDGGHRVPPPDKQMVEQQPIMLSVMSTPGLVNSPKRGQRKEDGWKEVVRKSKKVQVPASAISRVIGRAGCNINAIREVSGAHIEVEKNRGSGERVITIKGSSEATRQAHSLITALVTDTDKDPSEILPQSSKVSSQTDKSMYFIPPADTNHSSSSSSNSSVSSGNQQKSINKSLAPRLQQQQALASGNALAARPSSLQNNPGQAGSAWGATTTTAVASPRRGNKQGLTSGSFPSPGASMGTIGSSGPNEKLVTRQLFTGERRGFGSSITAVTATVGTITTPRSSPSSPSNLGIRQEIRPPSGNRGNPKQLVPGTVRVLQRPPAPTKHEPLPIVTGQATTVATSSTTASSAQGDFSPFISTIFSNAAQQILGKKEEERMNFASVAAAGVVAPFSGSPGMSSPTPPPPGAPFDPVLQAKAPGFKWTAGPRAMNPSEHLDHSFKGGHFPSSSPLEAHLPFFQGLQGVQNFFPPPMPSHNPGMPNPLQAGHHPRPFLPFDSALIAGQKEEYTIPNQPMTLPKISSTLNPNAPDFTSRSVGGPHGMEHNNNNNSAPGPQGLGGIQLQTYLAQHLAALNSGQVDSQSSVYQQEIFQNVANLMQFSMQNQPPGSPGPGPGPNLVPPTSFSPLPPQGRPSSAPTMGVLNKDGVSPTPIGPPRGSSPLRPSTPPMGDMMRNGAEDRRPPRPIGGERSQRKAPGPPVAPAGINEEGLWNLTSQLNMDWNPKTSMGMSVSNMSSSPLTTSVVDSGNMSASGDNHSPGLEDLPDQNFSQNVQSGPGIHQMPLYNGGSQYSLPHVGSAGDSMWNSSSTVNIDKEINEQKKMWESWRN